MSLGGYLGVARSGARGGPSRDRDRYGSTRPDRVGWVGNEKRAIGGKKGEGETTYGDFSSARPFSYRQMLKELVLSDEEGEYETSLKMIFACDVGETDGVSR